MIAMEPPSNACLPRLNDLGEVNCAAFDFLVRAPCEARTWRGDGEMAPKKIELREKLEIIERVRQGNSYFTVAREFGIGKATVGDIWSRREEFEKYAADCTDHGRKHIPTKESFTAIIDERIWRFFCAAREQNVTITGALLQEKARLVAGALFPERNFTASKGWLASFNERHNISCRLLQKHAGGASLAAARNWESVLRDISKDYDSSNIFCCDELGLFWRELPTGALMTPRDRAAIESAPKELVLVLLTTSMVGEKLEPLVVGDASLLRGLEHKPPKGIKWVAHPSVCMTAEIFSQYLRDLNVQMERQDRKILLLLDDASVHCNLQLSHVRLVLLPANLTAGAQQPLETCLCLNFKCLYRQCLMKHVISMTTSEDASADTTGLVDAVARDAPFALALDWIKESWKTVSVEAIQNCFAAIGIGSRVDDLATETSMRDIVLMTGLLHITDPVFDETVAIFPPTDLAWEQHALFPPDSLQEDPALDEVLQIEDSGMEQPEGRLSGQSASGQGQAQGARQEESDPSFDQWINSFLEFRAHFPRFSPIPWEEASTDLERFMFDLAMSRRSQTPSSPKETRPRKRQKRAQPPST